MWAFLYYPYILYSFLNSSRSLPQLKPFIMKFSTKTSRYIILCCAVLCCGWGCRVKEKSKNVYKNFHPNIVFIYIYHWKFFKFFLKPQTTVCCIFIVKYIWRCKPATNAKNDKRTKYLLYCLRYTRCYAGCAAGVHP